MAGIQELLQRLDSQSRHGSRSRGRQGNDTIFRSIESQRNNNQNDQDDQGQDDQDQDDQEEDQREEMDRQLDLELERTKTPLYTTQKEANKAITRLVQQGLQVSVVQLGEDNLERWNNEIRIQAELCGLDQHILQQSKRPPQGEDFNLDRMVWQRARACALMIILRSSGAVHKALKERGFNVHDEQDPYLLWKGINNTLPKSGEESIGALIIEIASTKSSN